MGRWLLELIQTIVSLGIFYNANNPRPCIELEVISKGTRNGIKLTNIS
jgi:hypothetical protein